MHRLLSALALAAWSSPLAAQQHAALRSGLRRLSGTSLSPSAANATARVTDEASLTGMYGLGSQSFQDSPSPSLGFHPSASGAPPPPSLSPSHYPPVLHSPPTHDYYMHAGVGPTPPAAYDGDLSTYPPQPVDSPYGSQGYLLDPPAGVGGALAYDMYGQPSTGQQDLPLPLGAGAVAGDYSSTLGSGMGGGYAGEALWQPDGYQGQ